jgi:hypothetical protein
MVEIIQLGFCGYIVLDEVKYEILLYFEWLWYIFLFISKIMKFLV